MGTVVTYRGHRDKGVKRTAFRLRNSGKDIVLQLDTPTEVPAEVVSRLRAYARKHRFDIQTTGASQRGRG